jgi:hypothetical protein
MKTEDTRVVWLEGQSSEIAVMPRRRKSCENKYIRDRKNFYTSKKKSRVTSLFSAQPSARPKRKPQVRPEAVLSWLAELITHLRHGDKRVWSIDGIMNGKEN